MDLKRSLASQRQTAPAPDLCKINQADIFPYQFAIQKSFFVNCAPHYIMLACQKKKKKVCGMWLKHKATKCLIYCGCITQINPKETESFSTTSKYRFFSAEAAIILRTLSFINHVKRFKRLFITELKRTNVTFLHNKENKRIKTTVGIKSQWKTSFTSP